MTIRVVMIVEAWIFVARVKIGVEVVEEAVGESAGFARRGEFSIVCQFNNKVGQIHLGGHANMGKKEIEKSLNNFMYNAVDSNLVSHMCAHLWGKITMALSFYPLALLLHGHSLITSLQ